MRFKLTSDYEPTGDQPQAIEQLEKGILANEQHQTLMGVTGSGKTFTVANLVARINRPTLVLSHNKTLAAQLYGEFKQFFPENAVEYFISYYDYYQPEAFIPSSGLYIEKDLAINEEIEKLRLSATSALLSGRRDVLVVASVSCIYGIGNPEEFGKNRIHIRVNERVARSAFLRSLTSVLYRRSEVDFKRGSFRVRGEVVDIFLAYTDYAVRIYFLDDLIEAIQLIDPNTGKKISDEEEAVIFPANLFVTGPDLMQQAIKDIQDDLVLQVKMFEDEGRLEEAKRLKERTEYDLEMMRELGYCSGIENYSRYFDRRSPGQRPFCLIDYFPSDFLMVIDESHVTLPQVRAMWGGDRTRKANLVDYGFRLPAAMDNRPLTFNEFEEVLKQVIYVSATPTEYELRRSGGVIIEQLIRPTGIPDPEIDVRPSVNQIDDLLEEVDRRVQQGERTLVTTLTKRMAEELAKFMGQASIKCRYIHSEVKTLDRMEILRQLRLGVFDVLVGVNLLREGLDLPEVSLVAILDADKEGFLRNQRSLIQTIGRAARNENGKVIMYADTVTDSMQQAIDETRRRRAAQLEHNRIHNIQPHTVKKTRDSILRQTRVADSKKATKTYAFGPEEVSLAADPVVPYLSKDELARLADRAHKEMLRAAKNLEFIEAAHFRDEYEALRKLIGDR